MIKSLSQLPVFAVNSFPTRTLRRSDFQLMYAYDEWVRERSLWKIIM